MKKKEYLNWGVLLRKVEATGPTLEGLREKARFLPYSGKSADKFLNQIDVLWQATKQNGRIRRIEAKDGKMVPAQSPKTSRKAPAWSSPTTPTRASRRRWPRF